MPTGLETFRAKYPSTYDNVPDEELAAAIKKKFYPNMPDGEYRAKMGLSEPTPSRPPRKSEIADPNQTATTEERLKATGEFVRNLPQAADDLVRMIVGEGLTAGGLDYMLGPEEQAKTAQAAERLGPVAAAGATAAGATIPAMFGVGLPQLAGRAPGALRMLARPLLAGAEGGAWGGASAGFHGEDMGEGALLGGAFGGAGQAAGELLGAASRFALPAARQAGNQILSYIKDPKEVQRLLLGNPDMPLGAALGEPGRRLARTASNVSPEGGEILKRSSEEFRESSRQKILDTYADVSGTPRGARMSDEDIIDTLNESRRAEADALYEQAYSDLYEMPKHKIKRIVYVKKMVPDPDNPFSQIEKKVPEEREFETDIPDGFYDLMADTSKGRQAWGAAKKVVKDDEVLGGTGGDLKRLDEAKKYADGQAAAAYRKGNNNEGRLWKNFSQRIRNRLETLPYEEARAFTQRTAKAREAVKRGVALSKPGASPSLLGEAIEARKDPLLADMQAQAYGMAQANKIIQSASPTKATRDFSSIIAPEKAEAIFGKTKAGKVTKDMTDAQIANQFFDAIHGNSTTIRQLADVALNTSLGMTMGAGGIYTFLNDPKTGAAITASAIASYLVKRGFQKGRAVRVANKYAEIAKQLAGRQVPTRMYGETPIMSAPGSAALGQSLLGEQ